MAKTTGTSLSIETGLFIAKPTKSKLKPIYKKKKTKNYVNNLNCKIGGVGSNNVKSKTIFDSSEKHYKNTFDSDVIYFPIAIIDPSYISQAKKLIITKIKKLGIKTIGTTHDWFPCDKGICFVDLIINTLKTSGIPHTIVANGAHNAICGKNDGGENKQ